MTTTGLTLLSHAPLRIPAHLRPAVRDLEGLTAELAETLTEYLGTKVTAAAPQTKRMMSHPPTKGAECFDAVQIKGQSSLRICLAREDLDTILKTLFGGPIDEVNLRATVAETVVKRFVAGLAGLNFAFAGNPKVQKAANAPLSTQPVISIAYQLTVADQGPCDLIVEVARPVTDTLAPPPKAVPGDLFDLITFPAAGILTTERFKLNMIGQWKPGDVVPLRKARIDRVSIVGRSKVGPIPLGLGELGADGGMRCLRIVDGAAIDDRATPRFSAGAGKAPSTAPAKAEADDMPAFATALGGEDASDEDEDDDDGFPSFATVGAES